MLTGQETLCRLSSSRALVEAPPSRLTQLIQGDSELRVWEELREIAAERGSHAPEAGFGRARPLASRRLPIGRHEICRLPDLVEGHVDALAILEEAGHEPDPGATYGVWAARQSAGGTTARLTADGWCLTGEKPFCSGSTRIDRALVTAECDDGYRLFDVSVAENVTAVHAGSWPAVGMAESLSETLDFGGPPVPTSCAIGPPNFYLERPGFWFGATGVAACWYGGARGLVQEVLRSIGEHPSELVLAELGHAVAHIDLMRRAIDSAAREIDDDPLDRAGDAKRRALVTTSRGAPRSTASAGACRGGRGSSALLPQCRAGPTGGRSVRLSGSVPRPTGCQRPGPHGMWRVAMELVVDDMHPGTDERTWLGSRELAGAPTPAPDASPPPGCRGAASR